MRQVVGFQLFLCELNSVEPFLYFSSSRDGDGFDVVGHMLCLVSFFFSLRCCVCVQGMFLQQFEESKQWLRQIVFSTES